MKTEEYLSAFGLPWRRPANQLSSFQRELYDRWSTHEIPLRRPYRGWYSLQHPAPIVVEGYDTTSSRPRGAGLASNRRRFIARLRRQLRNPNISMREAMNLGRRIRELERRLEIYENPRHEL